jgi:hypothetical protein
VGATAASLATLEVAVRGGGAAFADSELVWVHGQAHRTTRFAPVESGGDQDFVQALGLGLFFDGKRAGNNKGAYAVGHLMTFGHSSSFT